MVSVQPTLGRTTTYVVYIYIRETELNRVKKEKTLLGHWGSGEIFLAYPGLRTTLPE